MRHKSTLLVFAAGAALLISAVPAYGAKAPGGGGSTGATVTAQTVWTNFGPVAKNVGFTATQSYVFDEVEAIAAGWDSNPSVTVTGNCQGAGCNTNPSMPTPPEAPAPPAFNPNTRNAECTFWLGGKISDYSATKDVTVQGTHKWIYTFTYTWAGKVVSEKTAWELDSEAPETVNFNGRIAGLSAQSSKSAELKYSFSLLDSFGALRITNASLTANGITYPLSVSYVDQTMENYVPFGVNGLGLNVGDRGLAEKGRGYLMSTRLASSGDSSLIGGMNGDAAWLLQNDAFAGNNSGGTSLAYGLLGAQKVSFGVGVHTWTFRATVKGNSGSADQSVSVSSTVDAIGLNNCGS